MSTFQLGNFFNSITSGLSGNTNTNTNTGTSNGLPQLPTIPVPSPPINTGTNSGTNFGTNSGSGNIVDNVFNSLFGNGNSNGSANGNSNGNGPNLGANVKNPIPTTTNPFSPPELSSNGFSSIVNSIAGAAANSTTSIFSGFGNVKDAFGRAPVKTSSTGAPTTLNDAVNLVVPVKTSGNSPNTANSKNPATDTLSNVAKTLNIFNMNPSFGPGMGGKAMKTMQSGNQSSINDSLKNMGIKTPVDVAGDISKLPGQLNDVMCVNAACYASCLSGTYYNDPLFQKSNSYSFQN